MDEHLAVPGTLLLAVPQMLDKNFMHTVVLVCQHEAGGAYGIVVTRPAFIEVGRLFPEHALLSQLSFPVRRGGPVGEEAFQFLHRVPDAIAGGLELCGGLYLGGDLDSFAEYIATEATAARDVRCFVGYSGWGEGQLEAEFEIGSWLPIPFAPGLVFSEELPEVIWRRAIRSLGGGGEGLSHLPPDVSWN